ncbi:MAG: chorismate-binding protein [Balneolaceae bacterium]|nr:chorismate-binding protein [Balneolaceae bacterium]
MSRGKTATEDVHLEKYLLNSNKNRKEHQYVTKAIESSLRPFTKKIERSSKPDIKKLKKCAASFYAGSGMAERGREPFFYSRKITPLRRP